MLTYTLEKHLLWPCVSLGMFDDFGFFHLGDPEEEPLLRLSGSGSVQPESVSLTEPVLQNRSAWTSQDQNPKTIH